MSTKSQLFVIAAAAAFLTTVAPRAQASAEIDAFNEELDKEYGTYLDQLNDKAELTGNKKIKGGYVFSTFPASLYTNGGTYGLDGYVRTSCTSGVDAVRDLVLNKEIFKKAVVKKMKRIDCAFGGKAKDKFKLSFKDGRLLVTVSQEVYGAETAELVGDYVKKTL